MILVSVADKNKINQEALSLLIFSIGQKSPATFTDIFLLYPTGEVEDTFIYSIEKLGVKPIPYPLERLDDPYRTKFLLCSFFKELRCTNEYFLYLDPDHIALKPFTFRHEKSEVLVSSELKTLNSIKVPENILSNLEGRHFNTSIILGHIGSWRKIISFWENAYRQLLGIIPPRYLEEVAFSLAAKQANVNMRPIDSDVQGNFSCFNKNCSLFHYGGDSPVAIKTKQILGSKDIVNKRLVQLQQGSRSPHESWFLEEINDLLLHQEEDE